MGDEGHQYHAMEFLLCAYLQSGREAEAQRLIEEVKSLPKMKDMYGTDFDPQLSALTSFSAAYALELRHWKEAAALGIISPLDSGDVSITYKARAIGAAQDGNLKVAHANLQAIQNLHATYIAQKKPSMWINAVAEDEKVVTAQIYHAEGRNDAAISALREIANKEQGVFAPDGGIPAHEILGDILAETGQPQQALADEAELKVSPRRFNSLYGAGRASEAAKNPAKAAAYYQELLKACAGGDSTRPEIVHAQAFVSTIAEQN